MPYSGKKIYKWLKPMLGLYDVWVGKSKLKCILM